MLQSYLKTALRFLRKNRFFSAINIFGLTAGTLCCLYIVLYVVDQYSYDRHHKDAGDIYRVDQVVTQLKTGETFKNSTTAAPIVTSMAQNFPEIAQYTRVIPYIGASTQLLHYGQKVIAEKSAALVDSTFFDVFTYHFQEGNAATALSRPFSAVLTRSLSDRLFGTEDPVGKTITIENIYGKTDYIVRAIIDESLGKSVINPQIVVNLTGSPLGNDALTSTTWTRNNYLNSFVRLRPDADPGVLEQKLPALVNRIAAAQYMQFNMTDRLHLQPLTSVHTSPEWKGLDFVKNINPVFLNILLLIAFLIQLIACINFMNLSTARASKRAKEVGVRKVIGADRRDLVRQFLGESYMLSVIGVLFSVLLLVLLLPYLNGITGASVQPGLLADPRLWGVLLALMAITGLVAGSYPAFYLSAFQAIKVIKGNFTSHISAAGIRRSLVVFQFVLSIVLVTGIVVIYSQLNYIKNKDLGFDKDQKLVLKIQGIDPDERVAAFLNELRNIAGVQAVTNSSQYLNSGAPFFSNHFFLRGQSDADQRYTNFVISDEYFTRVNGLHLLSGRDFDAIDSGKCLINETYAHQLGLTPATAIGVHIYDDQQREVQIIGVMKNFNYSALYDTIENFMVWKQQAIDSRWPIIIMNTRTNDYHALLASIERLWKQYVPGEPFMYTFMDESVQEQYQTEIALSHIINAFTLMAILISCLGLFGLAAFSAEQRGKEIGIRKVLGASTAGLASLLSKDFLVLVGIAFVIALPLSWWIMSRWLENFAYRVGIAWWMFALSGSVSAVIALGTVSFQAIRAARANPIARLRSV
ncbi:ABC transporter permease [Dinghuibacter silviterrae]|uniref:Putative ABC transport system permease protein n=1 Tax=Dinghuibacter silviterrae TaxID=1539049 RepID=A0A4R8DHJ6_9BACT|nr:ABC transporter permease [Dinghuibacter silviterrae]TDW96918.1 putative ABC transport system permease protein [Dinghuibacter silviterrae]